jgi:hypothetical protein
MAMYRYGISIDFRHLLDEGAGRRRLGKSEAEHGDPYYRSETRPLTVSQKLIRAHA